MGIPTTRLTGIPRARRAFCNSGGVCTAVSPRRCNTRIPNRWTMQPRWEAGRWAWWRRNWLDLGPSADHPLSTSGIWPTSHCNTLRAWSWRRHAAGWMARTPCQRLDVSRFHKPGQRFAADSGIRAALPGTGIPCSVRADYTGASLYDAPVGYFLNPAAVTAPTAGAWGNAGRDSMTGAATVFHERIHGASVPALGSSDPEFCR